jgi:hypothetical protein
MSGRLVVGCWHSELMSVLPRRGGTRVRFPMVTLEFFIDVILLAALWPSASNRN